MAADESYVQDDFSAGVDLSGSASTLDDAGQAGNGSAEDAQFKNPLGICIDNDDVMYIGDSENRAIRR